MFKAFEPAKRTLVEGAGEEHMKLIDEVRAVLRQREALLVHFNTPMSLHDVGYPQDLRDALVNPNWAMCFSTILKTDVGPTHGDPANAAACGSVGIIVDLPREASIIRVHNSDGGSSGRTWGAGKGALPSVQTCNQSIENRTGGHNEWFLSGGKAVGIFCFPDPAVFNPVVGDRSYSIEKVSNDFPTERFFTVNRGQFYELDRNASIWVQRCYAEILSS